MNQNKPFMTYKQQIMMLKEDKKLEIEDENYAIRLLKEHSYFALISGYKTPFKPEVLSFYTKDYVGAGISISS